MELDKYLKTYASNDKINITHTKIPNKDLGIFGGKYNIPSNSIQDFYKKYKDFVFLKKKEAYLTEVQLKEGKILIDLDFRYENSINKKCHTKDHIIDFIQLCFNAINEIFIGNNETIMFCVFEKDNVNMLDDITKDGIHIIINIVCDFTTKLIFRNYLLDNINEIWDDLPLKNDWNEVIDEGVMKGNSPWQLYGSQKPGCEKYKLKYIFDLQQKDKEIILNETDIIKINFDKYFPYFCARNTENTYNFALTEKYKQQYEKFNSNNKLKIKSRSKCNQLEDIKSENDLDNMLSSLFDDPSNDYQIKELHDYTMSLPKEFWGPGSYNNWIRVGWVLKNTNPKLVLTWIKFSSQSEDFDFGCNDVLDYWANFDNYSYSEEGLTFRSIIYWCKINNYNEYKKIRENTISYHIYETFKTNTECDFAQCVYQMYKSQFVCTSITNNIWYQFIDNRWCKIDSGTTLRTKISNEVFNKFKAIVLQFQQTMNAKQNNIVVSNNVENTVVSNSNENEEFADFKKKINNMFSTCKLLKKTQTKNNIMKECKDFFYDEWFQNKLDKNAYLLGCKNCVIDFTHKKHRPGKHDDYVSKSTNLNYFPLEYYEKNNKKELKEIKDFISTLFPNKEIEGYMWEHLASSLIGTNHNQTFNIYNGTGANGKSKLVDLMTLVLGEYKGTVPISLITQKRTNIGSTSSEIYNLIGTRYAVMQEPSKGDKINEGIMKELTGGDPLQCRALFSNSITFIPQFKLIVCTNTLFDVMSNDDGTWRRLRKVDFESKFTQNPYNDKNFPREQYKHQFLIDTKIDEKFKVWAPIVLSILVDIAYKTQGQVNDVKPVLASTQEYRKDQDVLLEFHSTFIVPSERNDEYPIKQRDLITKFRDWHSKIYGGKCEPRGKEIIKFFEEKYGKYPLATGWTNIKYKYDSDDEDDFT